MTSRPLLRKGWLPVWLALVTAPASVAQTPRYDIVFVLDLSGSVDEHEIMQRNAGHRNGAVASFLSSTRGCSSFFDGMAAYS